MTTHDDDFNELTELLGHTKAAYHDLRHDHALRAPLERQRVLTGRRVAAIAACLLLGLVLLSVLSQEPGKGSQSGSSSRMALPGPAAMPSGEKTPDFSKLRGMMPGNTMTFGFTTPRRPDPFDD